MKNFTPEQQPGAWLIAQELWLDQGAPHHLLRAAFETVDFERDQDMDGAEPLDLDRVTYEVRTMEAGELETLCCGEVGEIAVLATRYPEADRCANFLFEVLFQGA